MQIFTKPNFNFIRWRWHAIVLSLVVILRRPGLHVVPGGHAARHRLQGRDDPHPEVRSGRHRGRGPARRWTAMPGEKVVQKYGAADGPRDPRPAAPDACSARRARCSTRTSRPPPTPLQRRTSASSRSSAPRWSGPVIGAQLQRKGVLATLFSILGITIYIAFRFRFSFALGAIVATFHDILVTLAFLAFFGYDLSLNVVAALLTITGYSVNDTIVIFDRVRENFRSMRRDSLEHIVNTSVNQTLGRTIITAGTTFLAWSRSTCSAARCSKGFAFTMIVGHHQRHVLDGVHRRRDRHHPEPAARAGEGAGDGRPRHAERRGAEVEQPQEERVPGVAAAGGVLSGCRARRRAGADRVPARVEFRPPDPGPRAARLGRRPSSASPSTWRATSARSGPLWPTSGRDMVGLAARRAGPVQGPLWPADGAARRLRLIAVGTRARRHRRRAAGRGHRGHPADAVGDGRHARGGRAAVPGRGAVRPRDARRRGRHARRRRSSSAWRRRPRWCPACRGRARRSRRGCASASGARRRRGSRSCWACRPSSRRPRTRACRSFRTGIGREQAWLFLIGMGVSGVVGYVTIKYFLQVPRQPHAGAVCLVPHRPRGGDGGLAALGAGLIVVQWLRRRFVTGFVVTVPLVISLVSLRLGVPGGGRAGRAVLPPLAAVRRSLASAS